jgi:hypothetical protein
VRDCAGGLYIEDSRNQTIENSRSQIGEIWLMIAHIHTFGLPVVPKLAPQAWGGRCMIVNWVNAY